MGSTARAPGRSRASRLLPLLLAPALLVIVYLLARDRVAPLGEVETSSLRARANRAIAFLSGQQNPNGSIGDAASPRFDVWETVNALLAIVTWTPETDRETRAVVQKALAFLRSSETQDGMVLHSSRHDGAFCLETTSEYIRLLALLKGPRAAEKLSRLRRLQQPDGRWKIYSPAVPAELQEFPSVTAFALRALDLARASPQNEDRALRFLEESQVRAGHWGVAWQFYGTPFYAMVPVLQLLSTRNTDGRYDRTIARARRFLIESQQEDGSWTHGSKLGGEPSDELHTALALQACLLCGLPPDGPTVAKGTAWLLSRQRPDGSWNGGFFPLPHRRSKKETIYATTQAMQALHLYLRKHQHEH